MSISIAMFERAILKELYNNNLAIFAGAGLSRGSGFVDWRGLLSNIAAELELDINKEVDLVSVAQYHFNENGRQTINEAIIEEFQRTAERNENVGILARLPIDTYWTTNYDSIIEDTLSDQGKIVDKKINQNQMKNYKPNRDVVVYKMHGDKEFPDEAVITRDDYEKYDLEKSLFTTQLKGELIGKTFIFIGFSFEDPNLEQVLSKIRMDLLGKSPKNHYCFFRRVARLDSCYKNFDGSINEEQFTYDKIKQDLKIKDLKRYGINAVLINEYSDITDILKRIEKKFKLNKIFISGSAETYGNYRVEEAQSLLHNLSKSLVVHHHHIVSGFGLGVGSYVINGALEEIFENRGGKINEYLTLRPFPQSASGEKAIKEIWSEYRREMLDEAGIIIFVFGNKLVDGEVIDADGILEEYQFAKDNGKYIIPIGSTGYITEKIFNEVKSDLDRYWYLKDSLEVLEKDRNEQVIISHIDIIIEKIKKEN
ncbi:SIR2 family protein [Bacillus pacificus]|uniref:SIR2 family protein n=1 Tax=Bacillus pacificus TaxID=2026187 RepID=UPI001E343200|nr:SIR2 family protein [Bacillus pacificus]MCC2389540.1 SIR2 family protein [Bacillus pacificus]